MSWTHTRSRIAHAKKADPLADVSDLRQQLKAERLEDYIARTVATAPPLTEEQRTRLAALLRPASGGGPPRVEAGDSPANLEVLIPADNPVSDQPQSHKIGGGLDAAS